METVAVDFKQAVIASAPTRSLPPGSAALHARSSDSQGYTVAVCGNWVAMFGGRRD